MAHSQRYLFYFLDANALDDKVVRFELLRSIEFRVVQGGIFARRNNKKSE
jgi:hypothetical protein